MKSFDPPYDSLIEELFSKHPSVQNAGFVQGAYKPGLDAMRAFASRLGNPQQKFRSIHIAGTNGKGSVSSMLAAALAAKGLKVGLYTSPHLIDFRERIKLVEGNSCSLIPKEYVYDFLNGTDTEGLSFFEITTGIAFSWFADLELDIAVIETGLGGRLDSTNIITPELSVITSIGLDHCALLGSTRAAIASEKAGIFKPGVPALAASYDTETGPVFENAAATLHCPLFFGDSLYTNTPSLTMDLQSPCQKINLRTVLCALNLLGVDADFEAISHTAAITAFRGRWERLSEKPEVICDIGHNPQALEINFRRLKECGRPLIVVYGIMADKDLEGIAPLMPSGAEYFLAAPSGNRAMPVNELARRLSNLRPDLSLHSAASVAGAVHEALELASQKDSPLVFIGGSTFVVAEAIPLF